MKNYSNYTVNAEEGVGKFICKQVDKENPEVRSVDLFNMNCTCKQFVYHGRPCNHIYASIMHVAQENKWMVIQNQPFNLLYLAYCWYHDKDNFQSSVASSNLAYPKLGSANKQAAIDAAEDVEDEEELNEEEYEIDDVMGLRIGANNVLEILVKWKNCSIDENSWASYSSCNFLFTSEFFLDFCDWFKKKFNISYRDDTPCSDSLPVCGLQFSQKSGYKADFGTNCNAISDFSTNIVVGHRKQLTAFFKKFNLEA